VPAEAAHARRIGGRAAGAGARATAPKCQRLGSTRAATAGGAHLGCQSLAPCQRLAPGPQPQKQTTIFPTSTPAPASTEGARADVGGRLARSCRHCMRGMVQIPVMAGAPIVNCCEAA
jgi:hypothetical protein